ncbi:MAG TPA: sialate O-acetylesterase [Pirellulales bacterium]
MKCHTPWVFVAACLVLSAASAAHAEVKLPAVLGSHMVLQRDMPLPIWGSADPGEAVSVRLDDQTAETTTDAAGNWQVKLSPVAADGKSHRLVVKGKNSIELEDILYGEVWLGSGQSNMEWQLKNTDGASEAIAAATHPQIRLFHVPKVQQKAPAKDVQASWKVCDPATVPAFSGVLYYFGQRLHDELKVPVGLINDAWGGSPIEPWTIAGTHSGGMYNGMIAPVKPFALRGVIWYQGETNAMQKNGLAYYDKMRALIEGWRRVWGQDLSFYFVQLAPWDGRYEPGQLPALWEAQAASLKIPGTGMVVTTDLVDNLKDIHPRNKRDVGQRLARWALAKDYGRKKLVYSGPLFRALTIEGNQARIEFAHADGGLKSRDGKPLTEFEIAGADGKFVPAEAVIDGDCVKVQSKEVTAPTQVRLGWRATANPNLVNAAGLPASPFQSNDWQGATGD